MLEWIGDLKRDVGADKVFASARVGVNRDPVQPVPRKDFSGAYLTEACERALKRMGVEALDAMVLHNPSLKTLARGEAWTALRDLKTAWKARLIGMSVGSEDVGRAALIRKPDLVVLPYNLFVPSMLHRLSSEISSSGAGVVVRSPLAYGLLADGWSGARRFSDDDHRLYRWTPRDLNHRMKQRDTLRQLLVLPPVGSLREASLRYVLANALVSVVTPGARTPDATPAPERPLRRDRAHVPRRRPRDHRAYPPHRRHLSADRRLSLSCGYDRPMPDPARAPSALLLGALAGCVTPALAQPRAAASAPAVVLLRGAPDAARTSVVL